MLIRGRVTAQQASIFTPLTPPRLPQYVRIGPVLTQIVARLRPILVQVQIDTRYEYEDLILVHNTATCPIKPGRADGFRTLYAAVISHPSK